MTGLAVLTRLPALVSARLYNVDESYLTAMGLTMGEGGRLYVDAVDRKPPVLPWLYSLSQRLVGSVDLRLLRGAATLAVAGTGLVVVMLVLRLGGNRRGAVIGGILAVLGTAAFPPADGQAANFELFALLPSSAAVLFALGARDKPAARRVALLVLAGACAGVAGMIKQPFFAILAPVGWEVWRGHRRIVDSAATLFGLVATVGLIGWPFGIGQVWRWAWVETGDYLDGQVGGLRMLAVLAGVVLLFTVLHLPAIAPLWTGRTRLRGVDPVMWWWLLAAVIAIIPGLHFIVHYFELLVPPLAVLAGLVLSEVEIRAQHRVLTGAAVVALACTVVAALPISDEGRVPTQLVTAVRSNSRPGDRILVWGALPEVYWRTGRLPAARFLSVGYLTGKWSDRPSPARDPEHHRPYANRWPIFDGDLRRHPPVLVVDMTTSNLDDWRPYPVRNYKFGRILEACYEPIDQVSGMGLWRLRDPACVARMAV